MDMDVKIAVGAGVGEGIARKMTGVADEGGRGVCGEGEKSERMKGMMGREVEGSWGVEALLVEEEVAFPAHVQVA